MNKKYENIPWQSEESYAKAAGQLRMALRDVFQPFQMYGLQEYIPGAIEEIVDIANDFSLRLRGVDKPIKINTRRNPRWQ